MEPVFVTIWDGLYLFSSLNDVNYTKHILVAKDSHQKCCETEFCLQDQIWLHFDITTKAINQ